MKLHKFAIFLSLVSQPFLSSSTTAEPYRSGWYQELQLSAGYENNVSRSYKREDQVSDNITTLSYGGGHSQKIGKYSQLIVFGYTSYNDFSKFDGLDNLTLTGNINWVYQPSPGYTSIWYNITSDLMLTRYRDYEAQEGLSFGLDANLNRRITTGIVGHFGYRYADIFFPQKDKHEKERDASFDISGHEVYAGIDFQFSRKIFLFAEYGFRKGDITSTISGQVDPISDYNAKTPDHVFNECNNRVEPCTPTWAYRIDTDMHKMQLGVSFPVRQVNMDLTASYYDAESNSGQSYNNWMLKMGLLWVF